MDSTLQAVRAGGANAPALFEAVVQRARNLVDLNTLSRKMLEMQQRNELEVTITMRDAVRRRVDQFCKQAKTTARTEVHEQLENMRQYLELNRLISQTALHDIGEAFAKPARAAGVATISFFHGLENKPYIGPVMREMRYFFGTTAPEAAKNVGGFISRWAEKLLYSTLASPSFLGLGNMPLLKGLTQWAEGNLARIAAKETIEAAVSLEHQADTEKPPAERQVHIVFKGMDKAVWERLSLDQQKTIDWKAKTFALIDALRKADRTKGKTADTPIEITLAGIVNLETEQRAVEARKTQERAEKVKLTWLSNTGTVKFEGDRPKAKKENGAWTVLLPNITHVDEQGAPVTTEAKLLKAALATLTNIQEMEVGGNGWEIRKLDGVAGLKATLPSGSDALLTALNTLAGKFATQGVRAKAFLVDESGTLQTDKPRISFVTEGGVAVFKWNKTGEVGTLPLFFDQASSDITGATVNTTKWVMNTDRWTKEA